MMSSAATRHTSAANGTKISGEEGVAAAARQRIDPPHQPPPGVEPSGEQPPGAGAESPAEHLTDLQQADWGDVVVADDELLRLHAADLIAELRAWIGDIDARESQLNARAALQDLRERQFRAWEHSQRRQWEEAQRQSQRQHDELQNALRRALIALTP